MANTDHPEKDLEDIMVHPLFRKAATTPAESWISTMASVNALLRDGINKDRLLIFTGDADGVSRYNGFDDIWDPKGDCKVRLENQDVRFNSKIIFETRSRDLIALISECVCEEGMHYNFRVPSLGDDVEKIGKHDLAIRNFIATIIRKPIIGTTLVSALEDLQIVVKHIFRLQRQPEKAIEFVQEYVQDLKLDNCTNRPADIGLFLAWTERTHWSKAFVETFAHCVGMLNCGVLDQEALDDVSPTTRALLEHSCTHMHYCLTTVEMPMTIFGISPAILGELGDHAGIKQSLLAFQEFLGQHYAQIYGKWPPPVHQNSGHWITRSIVQRLQQDFGNLYDLTVETEHRDSTADPADPFGCGLDREQLFKSWDRQYGFNPLPHANPKAPDYYPTLVVEPDEEKGARRSSLIPAMQKHVKKGPELHNIYSGATNEGTYVSTFCKAFLKHEASSKHEEMDTHDGRLGRWIVVYCMMQLLSKVAVDIQGLRHSRGVEYFLNADLDGTPPWNPDDFPVTMRPVSAYYSWAALFAKANGPPRRVSRNSAKKGSKAKFNVEYLPDGRVMLKDADGHVVFR
ncbi:hypothetical protein D6C84_05810 [Aureobasidium pullulans]|uniref:DUF8004 domain-containing protein n=1 Tax=Aureobasidium pullulans TaxID=5580 RepID=A0A4S9XTT4_AURPU|nr:hypothetical protein D6C84_05810 [Aureobasidium pullulans]